MKRGFGKGFLSGILVAALAVGLGASALAAARTITVDDNIRVTINGAQFTPKNEQGQEVPLFSYDGTTYAPVRAICEAAGMKVDYDSATYTAVLTTQEQYLASNTSAADYITADKAKEIALQHAGVSAADAVFVKAGLDWDDGRVEYEVEFYAGTTEYDYEIDASTGAVLSYDLDWDDFSLNFSGSGSAAGSTGSYISADKAKEIALSHAGVSASAATFVKAKLDWDDGRMEYEVEFYANNTEYDYEIDATSGTVLSYDKDWKDTSSNSSTAAANNLISESKAKEIALAKAPSGAAVVKCELDFDDGRWVYEIEMRSGRTEYDCEVNASTGTILDWDVDYD